MTLTQILKAVDELSAAELRQLKTYIEQRQVAVQADETPELKAGTLNMDALLAAVDAIREGMSEDELAEMTRLMNEETIEPVDGAEWDE